MKENFQRLTLVTNKGHLSVQEYIKFIGLCVKAGVTAIQLREKLLPYKDLRYFGQLLKTFLDLNNIPLIINDNIDLCLQLDASGVHLGQKDGDPAKARYILGPDKIIGLSVNNFTQIENSNNLPIDYIGVGAIFYTKNKPDIETIWGVEGLKKASLLASHRIIVIGGIEENNALSVINAGASGIAGISVFHDAADPYQTTQSLIKIINKAHYAK